MDSNTLRLNAQNIRKNIIRAGLVGGHAHFGGSLSVAEILSVLFGRVMRIDANEPEMKPRDRFILSKGHCALGLYAALHEFGFLTEEQLMSFNQNGGDFPTHCVRNLRYGIEVSSGSLGMGLSFGIGQALALKGESNVFVLAGNGEINEGSFWEAAMFAGSHGIGNICLIVDDNRMQLDGFSEDIMPNVNWGECLSSFGWNVVENDGHDIDSLSESLSNRSISRPYALVAHTIKGKCISFMENNPDWHHNSLTEEQYQNALSELEALK